MRLNYGLLGALLLGVLSWWGIASCTAWVYREAKQMDFNPGPVCEDLRAHGWDVEQSECVQALLDE